MALGDTLKNNKMYALAMAQAFAARNLSDFYQNLLKQHGLTTIEWFVLGVVSDATKTGGIRVTDLAMTFNVKTTYITSVLNGLRTKDYVENQYDANDARVRLAIITQKGSKELPVIERSLRSETARLLDDVVTGAELEQYARTASKLATLRQL